MGIWPLVSNAQQNGPEKADESPRSAGERAQPALEQVGPWRVFAADRRGDRAHGEFHKVEATARHQEARIRLAADRLEVVRIPWTGRIVSMVFVGNVRIDGVAKLYLTAEQAFTLRPYELLDLVGAESAPTAGAERWRLGARYVRLDLKEASVELEGLIAAESAPNSTE